MYVNALYTCLVLAEVREAAGSPGTGAINSDKDYLNYRAIPSVSSSDGLRKSKQEGGI